MIRPMGVIDATTHADAGRVCPLDWAFAPGEALARWPDDEPLGALVSAPGGSPARARWSILARPERIVRRTLADVGAAGVLDELRSLLMPPMQPREGDIPPIISGIPFRSGWIGVLTYELGGALEPRALAGVAEGAADPAVELHRCPGAFVHDGATGRWFAVGDASALPDLSIPREGASAYRVGSATSDLGRASYEAGVARAIEYIRAGDVFQVNLAHHLGAPFEGSPRAMFRELVRSAAPWYGAYVESKDEAAGAMRAVCSISPELFLEYEPETRRVATRPIKGTRPGGAPADELIGSEKDAAELVMIVDLMRNDLGRACVPGSVRVPEARCIERHGGVAGAGGAVQHGVATIEGVLREGLDAVDLVGAAFPAGSITGAPKVRAMQIIGELEGRPRGTYCGAVGYFSDCGRMALNVAIRTACVTGEQGAAPGRTTGEVSYGVGAGIVADSDPASEWAETLDKASGFLRAIGSTFDG